MVAPLRVLLYTTGFFEYCIELANALANEQGLEITLVVCDRIDPRLLPLADERVNVIPFRNVDFVSFRRNLGWVARMIHLIRRQRPQVIHMQAYGQAWWPWLMMFFPKTAFVNTVHDPNPHSGDMLSIKGLKLFRHTIPMVDLATSAVFVHGHRLKEEFLSHRSVASSRVHVIPHGEFSIYERLRGDSPTSENSILFFGRIWPYKGLDIFLKAALKAVIQEPTMRFVIAGKGEDVAPYLELIRGKEQFFQFINERIDISRVASLITNSQFLVLPYKDATQSGVVPLAFAFGKTVVASAVGSLPEVIRHRQNGLLVSPCDEEELSSSLLELWRDSDLRRRLECSALVDAKQTLSWTRVAKKSAEVYRAITGEQRAWPLPTTGGVVMSNVTAFIRRSSLPSPIRQCFNALRSIEVGWRGRFSRNPLVRRYIFLQKTYPGEILFWGNRFHIEFIGGWLEVDSLHEFLLQGFSHLRDLRDSNRCSLNLDEGGLQVEFDGLRFTIDTYDELYILKEIFLEECYNLHSKEPVHIVDIGMNVGMSSLYFASRPWVEKVYGFEPMPNTYAKAVANLAANSAGAKVIPANQAVGNSGRQETWNFDPRHRGQAGASFVGTNDSVQVRVQIEDVADVLQAVIENRTDRALWLKLDCEGAEYEILPRVVECKLLHAFDAVLMEWHDISRRRLLTDLLVSQGYTVAVTRENTYVGMLYAFRTNRQG